MTEKLKPCPFCGREAVLCKDNHDKYGIVCYNCQMYFGIELEDGCELEEGWRFTVDTVDRLEKAWNRRADNG